jgi:hypothetical protein
MGSSGNIDILYMEKIQREWEDSVEGEKNKTPIKFPVSMDSINIDLSELNFENFSTSPAIKKRSSVIKSEEVNTKKSKKKCNRLL